MRVAAFSFTVLTALAAMGFGGCKRAQPSAKAAAPVATPVPTAPAASDEADRERRPRLGEAAVYVDGVSRGVVRRLELPVGLKSHVVKRPGGYDATRFYFGEYARTLGIDPSKVRALHLYGGSRVAVVDKAEWQRIGGEIAFSFSQGERGKPRITWPAKKLYVNTTIDMLSAVAFYVDKEPPHLDEEGELVMPDGSPVAGQVPYAPVEQGKGTRVYVDGALTETVKRKRLTNDLVAPADARADEPTKFSLLAYTKKLGVDPHKAKSIDLIAGDDVVAHLAPEAAASVTFHVPARNQGQILVDLPEARQARISAVQVFVKSQPPSRTVVDVDDAREAAPGGRRERQGAGEGEEL